MTDKKLKKEVSVQYCAYCEEIDKIFPLPEGENGKNILPNFLPGAWDISAGKNIEIITLNEVHERREVKKRISNLSKKEEIILDELENFNSRTINESYKKRLSMIQNIIIELNSLHDEYNSISIWLSPFHKEIEKAKLIKSSIETITHISSENSTEKENIQYDEEKLIAELKRRLSSLKTHEEIKNILSKYGAKFEDKFLILPWSNHESNIISLMNALKNDDEKIRDKSYNQLENECIYDFFRFEDIKRNINKFTKNSLTNTRSKMKSL